jgi:DNA anti-recombination protein RmuC
MELGSSGLTAALVVVVLALVKVIEWVIRRRNGNSQEIAQKPFNGFNDKFSTINERLTKIEADLENGMGTIVNDFRSISDSQRQLNDKISDIRGYNGRLGDKINNLSSKIDKLSELPAQMGRLADAITDLKDEIKKP